MTNKEKEQEILKGMAFMLGVAEGSMALTKDELIKQLTKVYDEYKEQINK